MKDGDRIGTGWRTDKKSVDSFSKQRSKEAKPEQPRKLFASFLLFLDKGMSRSDLLCDLFKSSKILELSTDEQLWRYSAPCLMSAGKDCSPSPSLLKLVMKLPVTSVKVVSAFKHLKASIFQYTDKLKKI